MATYNILRAVPLNERILTAKSLKIAYPETGEVVDIIVNEVTAYDSEQHVFKCATKLFDSAIVSKRLHGRKVIVVKAPIIYEVPSMHGGSLEYSSTSVHMTKTYTLYGTECTFGLNIDKEKDTIAITAISISENGKVDYKGEKVVNDTFAEYKYPPGQYPISAEWGKHKLCKQVFEDGFIFEYEKDSFFNQNICIKFPKAAMDEFLSSYVCK